MSSIKQIVEIMKASNMTEGEMLAVLDLIEDIIRESTIETIKQERAYFTPSLN